MGVKIEFEKIIFGRSKRVCSLWSLRGVFLPDLPRLGTKKLLEIAN